MASRVAPDGEGMAPGVRWALAIGCAVTVANIYYAQPLLEAISHSFHVSERQAGIVATLSQVGYALGMFLVVPLGDLMERKGLAMTTIVATAGVALGIAASPNFLVLCVASLAVGFTSCTPQLLLPFAAALSLPQERGKTVGFVVSGLLLGILLARTASGLVGEHFGWRTVFFAAAVVQIVVAVVYWLVLPSNRADHGGLTYRKALASLPALLREEPILRESVVYGACLFGAFSAFWTTLAFYLARLGFGPEIVGLFGLVGAAGASVAPIAGKLADRGGPRRTVFAAIVVTLLSFAMMAPGGILLLVAGVLSMDVGVQAAQVTNLSRVYALRPLARSRLNTIYMTTYFLGGAAGSAVGSWAWSAEGWSGVCLVGAVLSVVALGNYFRTR